MQAISLFTYVSYVYFFFICFPNKRTFSKDNLETELFSEDEEVKKKIF